MARTNQPYAVTYDGLDVVLKQFSEFSRRLDGLPNRELREHAQGIAEQMLPAVRSAVASSPAPQAAAVSVTARSKRDRIPVVRIGATIPKLSGMRGKSNNKAHKGSVAWGVERGPHGGHRSYRPGANFYQVGRNPGGYGVAPRLPTITARMLPAYVDALGMLMRRWGMI